MPYLGNQTTATDTVTQTRFICSAAQTTFSVTYDVGAISVYLNGILLDPTAGVDYTADNGTSVVLTSGASLNDLLIVESRIGYLPSDVVSASAGGTFSGAVVAAAGATVPSGQTLTIASGATIANSGTATGFSASTLAASTTVGTGAEEDTKIVFDGNAQDFHIGLDDTADSLAIGLGSALGTTDHMVFNAIGAITKPLQPGFFSHLSGTSSNQTGDGTLYLITCDTEIFDNNDDHSNGVFTDPVTGIYSFTGGISLGGLTTSHTILDGFIADNSHNFYQFNLDAGNVYNGGSNLYLPVAAIIKMDSGDTASIKIVVSEGSKVVDVFGAGYPFSWFSGYLLG